LQIKKRVNTATRKERFYWSI